MTGKFKRGEYGLLMEFGRPCVGTRFREMEKVTLAMRARGLPILEDNPVLRPAGGGYVGRFKPDMSTKKWLSAILETRFQEDELEEILGVILPVLDHVKTVVSVGLSPDTATMERCRLSKS